MIDQLMALFADWRAFEAAPLLSDGVPPYNTNKTGFRLSRSD
jgi:hypothetical protein